MDNTFWIDLFKEIKYRLIFSIKFPSFLMYFVVVIMGIGMSGVFITIRNEIISLSKTINHENIIISICTYFMALISSSSVELIMVNHVKYEKSKKSLIMLGIVSILISIGLFWCATVSIISLGYFITVLGLIFSFFIWWLANAYNQNLVDNKAAPIPSIEEPLKRSSKKFKI